MDLGPQLLMGEDIAHFDGFLKKIQNHREIVHEYEERDERSELESDEDDEKERSKSGDK